MNTTRSNFIIEYYVFGNNELHTKRFCMMESAQAAISALKLFAHKKQMKISIQKIKAGRPPKIKSITTK